jgi:hypothetical protein
VERATEFILGLIGGILGIFVAPGLFFLGGIVAYLGGGAFLIIAAIGDVVLSIIGLIGVAFVRSHTKLAGLMMLISGIFGLMFALGLWVGALLFTVAGAIAIIRKEEPPHPISLTVAQPTYYCTSCGKPLVYISHHRRWFCENCKIYPPTKEDLLREAVKAIDRGDTTLAKRLLDQARQ